MSMIRTLHPKMKIVTTANKTILIQFTIRNFQITHTTRKATIQKTPTNKISETDLVIHGLIFHNHGQIVKIRLV